QADAALGVAEGDELLAHQLDAHRRPIGFSDLARQAGGAPVAPHRIAHRRSGAGACDQLVFFLREHAGFSGARWAWTNAKARGRKSSRTRPPLSRPPPPPVVPTPAG